MSSICMSITTFFIYDEHTNDRTAKKPRKQNLNCRLPDESKFLFTKTLIAGEAEQCNSNMHILFHTLAANKN